MEFVKEFGTKRYARDGCFSYSMDKKARYRAKVALGHEGYRPFAEINIYVIVTAQGTVRTAAHKTRRTPRHH